MDCSPPGPCVGISRQEYWSGLPFPSPEGLSDPAMEPLSPTLQVDSFPSEPPGKPLFCDMGVKTPAEGPWHCDCNLCRAL